jgi:hypothetical protein
MATLRDQLALRKRLRAVENDLVGTGKRAARIQGAAGVFTWVRPGADPANAVDIDVDGIQKIEDMIVIDGSQDTTVTTEWGTFTWKPRST